VDDADLYTATVPVLRHYLARLDAIVAWAGPGDLDRRLAEGMFPAGAQFATAQGFALRAVFPPMGQAVPDLPPGADATALVARSVAVGAHLAALGPADFAGAAGRAVRHRAGMAEVVQPGVDYALRYALPNFFFHLTMGYAALRASGVDLGKADFDGIHVYPPGFRF
jgi:hypothetical protein